MSDAGRKIIEGLQYAVRGNFTRVTIQGQVWVRHDVGSPEHELSTARAKVAELTERVDVLEAALRLVDDDVRHHIRSDEIGPALIRPKAVKAVRELLK